MYAAMVSAPDGSNDLATFVGVFSTVQRATEAILAEMYGDKAQEMIDDGIIAVDADDDHAVVGVPYRKPGPNKIHTPYAFVVKTSLDRRLSFEF